MQGPSQKLRIVVLGYIIRGPVGGMAWHHLQYVLGLAALGHEVLFLEDSDDYPSCYDPSKHVVDVDPTYGLAFARQAFDRLGLGDDWTYYDAHEQRWYGLGAEKAQRFCDDADMVINVSGVNPLRRWTMAIERRLFIDTDPVFTQVNHLADPAKRDRAAAHNRFFSFGEALNTAAWSGPRDEFNWLPTRQPVVRELWSNSKPQPRGRFTTVMQWDSYPAVEYRGSSYGMKSEAFQDYLDLPRRVDEQFELALGSATAPRERLRDHGWHLVDPLAVTRDPWTYQHYIDNSKAEFSVAKQGYVASRCGWFSERSACYLAAGKPVVVQDTGFSDRLPTGAGLLSFTDVESAAAAVADVSEHYDAHCRAARDVCAAHFDSGKVLQSLIERSMNG
jgi:hypothetical protein